MKILVLATTFPRWSGDTEPSYVFRLSASLVKEGNEMFVLVPHAQGAKRVEEVEGLKIFRFRYFYPDRWEKLCYEGGILPKLRSNLMAWVNLPFFLGCQAWAIGHTICQEKVDVVHAHWLLPQGLFAVLWSFWFKVPVVTTIHGSDLMVFRRGPFGWLIRFVLSRSAAITVNSQTLKEKIPTKFKDRVYLIPMGVDFEVFHPGNQREARLKVGLGDEVLLLGVGRLSEQKGFHYLIEAVSFIREEFQSVRLILIGEGPERKRLIQLVERLGLQNVVEFKGGIPQTQLADYYRASDVFILPSIRTKRGEEEAFGLVLAEAMASGLPVIGTRTGGISSLIEDQKTGLMVEEGDPPGVAAAIRRILCEGALRDRLVQGGMEKVKEKCEWNHIASRFDQIFQQVKGPHSSMGQED